jgi:hypothetical protein
MKIKTGITICKSSEVPNDSRQYSPENGYARSYKTITQAVSVCSRLLNNPRSGWSLGKSFQGFYIAIEDGWPVSHARNGVITIWFN